MIIPKIQTRILLIEMLAIFLTVNLIDNPVLAQAVFKGDQAEAFFEEVPENFKMQIRMFEIEVV